MTKTPQPRSNYFARPQTWTHGKVGKSGGRGIVVMWWAYSAHPRWSYRINVCICQNCDVASQPPHPISNGPDDPMGRCADHFHRLVLASVLIFDLFYLLTNRKSTSLSLLLSQKATGLIISVYDFYFFCGRLRIYELYDWNWMFLISIESEQLEFKWEKNYWDLETCRKS